MAKKQSNYIPGRHNPYSHSHGGFFVAQAAQQMDSDIDLRRKLNSASLHLTIMENLYFVDSHFSTTVNSMITSADQESQLLAIAMVDQQMEELTQLIEMYKASKNKP